jgi:hypothetical protein
MDKILSGPIFLDYLERQRELRPVGVKIEVMSHDSTTHADSRRPGMLFSFSAKEIAA